MTRIQRLAVINKLAAVNVLLREAIKEVSDESLLNLLDEQTDKIKRRGETRR